MPTCPFEAALVSINMAPSAAEAHAKISDLAGSIHSGTPTWMAELFTESQFAQEWLMVPDLDRFWRAIARRHGGDVSQAVDALLIALNGGEDIFVAVPNRHEFCFPGESEAPVRVTMQEPRGDLGGCGRFVCPAAEALSHLIARGTVPVRGKRVLELGAGIGLCGVLAAVAGAEQVLITDIEPLVLEAAQHNAQLNSVGDRVRTAIVDWSQFSDEAAAVRASYEAGLSMAEPSKGSYEADQRCGWGIGWVPDVLIAADVCYSGEHGVMLLEVVVHLWKTLCPDAQVWIVNGYPNRGLRRFEAFIGATAAFQDGEISLQDPNTSHFAKWHNENDVEEARVAAALDDVNPARPAVKLCQAEELVDITGPGVKQRSFRLAYNV